ncbi:MAG: ferrochelatase [Acidobacteria bacterium]|nr:ferrochelatase [Acidobacteriota bacterium]
MGRFSSVGTEVHGEIAAVGVLLTNVGTPEAPTPRALRRYLRQFLSDPRVVELPRPLWWLILNLLVLPLRPRRSARLYAKVWTPDGSPLLVISRRIAAGVESALRAAIGTPLHVALGMGYGSPSIGSALRELRTKGCRRIVVLPLFPQYASPTSGSTFDGVAAELATWRWVPELRMVGSYHDDEAYVAALAAAIRELWEREGVPDRLLLSFHGLPRKAFLAGDPYFCHCQKTARLLREALDWPEHRVPVAFQSRFGREPWLQPYTDATLRALGQSGVASVDVACPGFAADCLETLEEIALLNRDVFLTAGGRRYRYVPALNERADHVAALAGVARRSLEGWIEPAGTWDAARAEAAAAATRLRAEGMEKP